MNRKKRFWMRTVILAILASAIGVTLYANLTSSKETAAGLVGKKAPDFILSDLDGNQFRLSDYQGKGVFLNFWGTYCEPCKDEMPDMDNQYQIYKDQDVEILAVNVGETQLAIQSFADQYQLSFPIIVDKTRDVQGAYGIYPLPATFLIDSEGVIVDYITGRMNEQAIQRYMERIKP